MSYHVYIIRTRGSREEPIAMPEVAVAASGVGGLAVSFDERGSIELGKPGEPPLLFWSDGHLWTRSPEPETLALMIELAAALGGRVRGDELETYRSPDDTYEHPDDAPEVEEALRDRAQARRRRTWMQFRFHAVVFGTFLLLAVVVALFSRR